MYQAKAAGRNTVRFFDPEMQALATERAALAVRPAPGLAREPVPAVDYQPQVGPDGRMIGVEALLRWKHPQRGMVPPAQFIPRPKKPRSSSRSATGC
jgi:predicted signal transduction protein with EAL and GGDEF domain